jgi:hypothetical protein
METNTTRHHFGHRDVTPVVKVAAVLLGLAVLGYVAVTQGQHASPLPKVAPVVAAESGKVDVKYTIEVPDAEWLTNAVPALEEKRGAIDAPRECDLRKGIDTACIFN